MILETGAEVHLLKGTFQFDDLRDDLEEQGHEEDSYREYEVWYGQRNYALFEDDGYVIVSRNKDATEEVLKTLYRGSGSLADAENDNELKRILDKLGNAPVVLAVVGDSCTVKRCQGYGMAAISYDIGEEELSSELVVLFSSERAAEDAADDYDDVADFIEQTMDLDVADTTSDGEFVLGTGTESYAPPTPAPTATAPPPTEAPAATEATATTAPPPTEAPAREVPTAGPTATPEPTEIANMSNLDIARDIVECGIDDDRDDDILDITSSQPGVGERQAAIKMEEMYSRRDLIDYYYDFCE